METKITKDYFQFGVNKYFRGNAHLVEIGTFGEKKDPIGPKAYLDPQAKVASDHLASRVEYTTRAIVDWNEVSKGDLEVGADLKFFGLGKKAAASFGFEKGKEAKLELVNLAILEEPLKKMLNTDANAARNFLAEEGNDGRIVSEVFVWMDGELGEHFATYGSASAAVKAFGSSLDITVTGGKHGSQTISLSKGTAFAFKLHKVKSWNKDKTKIENLEADYKGMS